MKIENYKTMCCNTTWSVKSRANFRCDNCNTDITMEVVLLADTLNKDKRKIKEL